LRVFSAYGSGLQKQIFWDLHQKNKTKSENVSLFGTGKETRDFIHVLDLVTVIELVIKNCNFNNDRINVANGQELTIQAVAETFYSIYNPSKRIKFEGQVRQGDPVNWVADISKINKFGFQGKVKLNDGLENYIKWVKELE